MTNSSSGYETFLDSLVTGDTAGLTPEAVTATTEQLSQAGLGGQVASWIGAGPNQPVTGEQIANAVGAKEIADLAEKAGATPADVAEHLAVRLPLMVDAITPDGDGGYVPDVVPTVRGLIDGSLNNLHAADKSNVLGAMVGSRLGDGSNNVANSRNEGNRNSAVNN